MDVMDVMDVAEVWEGCGSLGSLGSLGIVNNFDIWLVTGTFGLFVQLGMLLGKF